MTRRGTVLDADGTLVDDSQRAPAGYGAFHGHDGGALLSPTGETPTAVGDLRWV
jgi:hypothetical protein